MNLPPELRSRGERREGRFNVALWGLHRDRPWWYLGTRQASVVLDTKGVDFWALLLYPKIRQVVEVPVQVKRSEQDFVDYYRKHPYAVGADIVEMVDPHTAGSYLAKLSSVRDKQVDYQPYYAKLERVRRDEPHHLLLIQQMEEDRRQRPLRLPPTSSPPWWIRIKWLLAAR